MPPRDLLVRLAAFAAELPGAAVTVVIDDCDGALLDAIGRTPSTVYIDGSARDEARATVGRVTIEAHGAVRPATDAELDALAERFAANALELRRLEAEYATATEEAA